MSSERQGCLAWVLLASSIVCSGSNSIAFAAAATDASAASAADDRYFPSGILHATWQVFRVAGYHDPVTGVIYRGEPRPTCGMPLGGLDTGCVDIEPNGLLGYATVFNHLINPRLLYNVPFLGISVGGQSCLLATDTRGKADRPTPGYTTVGPATDYTPVFFDLPLKGVRLAKSIDYFGHYPVLDMEFDTGLPVSVGLRAWSSFLPGDTKISMLPGAVFEFSLRNPTQQPQHGTLAFSFPGFESPLHGEGVEHTRSPQSGQLNGVLVATSAEGNSKEMSYLLATTDDVKVRTGGSLGTDGAAWNAIEAQLPVTTAKDSGATVAIDFNLAPGQVVKRRFILTWYAPHWNASGAPGHEGSREFTHMYGRHYRSAIAAAERLATDHKSLLDRIIAWQEEIYGSKEIPGWLADSLVNNLHLITETSVWAQGTGPLQAFSDCGLFGMCECPRGCPQIECIPCSFYGNMPVVYFFPDAALSTLRGYKQYQFADGRPPWIFGGVTAGDPKNKDPYDEAAPDKGYQTILNTSCYVVMFDRYWQTTHDDKALQEFYPSLKKANDFSMNLRPKYGPSQVVSMPEPGTDGSGETEWFEAGEPGWRGYVTHAGGVRMAQVQIMKRIAQAAGDAEYAEKCDRWLEAGSKALEDKLWNGKYYLNYIDPDSNVKSDLIFGYQLDGQWVCNAHGVDGVFPKPRVGKTLDTIRQANCAISQSGAANYTSPEGQPVKVGGYGTYSYFPPEVMMLAMTYMYDGQREFGTELLRRCMDNIVCHWGYTWDAPNIMRGDADTGQRQFGADYYQDMMLWFVPAALAGEDLTGPIKQGGLVERVIRAARGEQSSR
jgi:non-lysosomal glucosylceramidase